MRIPDYILTAQTNLLRTKARTFLTILAFVVGTFTLAMTTALGEGLQSHVNMQLSANQNPTNKITVTLPPDTKKSASGVPYYDEKTADTDNVNKEMLTAEDLKKIKDMPGIQHTYPSYGEMQTDYIQFGTQPKYSLRTVISAFPDITWQLSAGDFPTAEQENGIVLPYPYIGAFDARTATEVIGKTATIQVTNAKTKEAKKYTVVVTGVFSDSIRVPHSVVAQPLATAIAQFNGLSETEFDEIVAVTDSSDPSHETREQLKQELRNDGYEGTTYDDVVARYSQAANIARYGLGTFACITILAAAIGIINTLLMSVFERTGEIGLLKALGMRRRGIAAIYLIEAASIGFWSGVIGVIGAMLFGIVANPILGRTLFEGIGNSGVLSYPLPYMAGIIAGGTLIGLLAGTIPAIRASRLDPIEALRRE